MYFALNKNIDNIENYKCFLRDIIESHNEHYKSIFREIIEEAKKLEVSKDYYSISRERFAIISLLSEKSDLLESIDSQNLVTSDFEHLLETIETEH